MCVMLLHKLLKYGAPLRASACGVGWATSQGKHAQARPCSVRDSMEVPEMYLEVFDAAVTHHYLCFDFFNFFTFSFSFFFYFGFFFSLKFLYIELFMMVNTHTQNIMFELKVCVSVK
jgi:hypothetical protein